MLAGMNLAEALELGAKSLEHNDLSFYRRVWATELDVYRERLRAVGFIGMEKVLDAGCGFGQWTFCLAELNGQVCAVDVSAARIKAAEMIMRGAGVRNVELNRRTVELTGYADSTFDGIFCYSALYMTDVKRTLREFFRLLKPGGSLYICSNGPGWYVYNLIEAPNQAADYSPRRRALRAVRNTFAYDLFDKHSPGDEVIISSRRLKRRLEAAGFERAVAAPEGNICLRGQPRARPFFKSSYWGLEGVYEILAYKKSHV
jgi:ubiquinone/menaquinone biosynthesis C-methylase UbiE